MLALATTEAACQLGGAVQLLAMTFTCCPVLPKST